tara:strand:- start:2373 stop:2648 length:276 start_codon:yes stop_codon:yes gene_type:complete
MSFRFWRRISLHPNIKLNISKTGISITFGRRGLNWTIGRKGNTASVGLPGTGLSYRKHVPHPDINKITKKEDNERKLESDDKNKSILDEFD